jgi:hypothetical protein
MPASPNNFTANGVSSKTINMATKIKSDAEGMTQRAQVGIVFCLGFATKELLEPSAIA